MTAFHFCYCSKMERGCVPIGRLRTAAGCPPEHPGLRQILLRLRRGDGAAGFSLMDVDTLVRHDLPVWVSTPHVIRWSDVYGPVQRHEVPGVQGAFVLSNVLAVDECEQILRLSEAMGYTEDAP